MAQSSQKIRHFSVSLIFIFFLALFFESIAPNDVVVKLVRRPRDNPTRIDLEEFINQGYEIAGMAENHSEHLFTLVKKEDDGTQAETHAKNGSNAVVDFISGENDVKTKAYLASCIDLGYEIVGMAKNCFGKHPPKIAKHCSAKLLFAFVKKDGTKAKDHGTNEPKSTQAKDLGTNDPKLQAKDLGTNDPKGTQAKDHGTNDPKLQAKDLGTNDPKGTQAKGHGTNDTKSKQAKAHGTNEPKAVVQLVLGAKDDQTKKDLANWINQGYAIAGMAKLCSGKLLFALVKKDGTKGKAHGTNGLNVQIQFQPDWPDYNNDQKERSLEFLINKRGYEIAGVAKTGETIHSLWPQPIFMWILVKIEEINIEMIEQQKDKQIEIVNHPKSKTAISKGVAKLVGLGQQLLKKRGN
ncbi:hypothetical protein niasHT_019851 [Heterodera trifolii]|uniref:Transmembrane protein n=1 Tax=Heterodera trifolii TaxID=157864 RepID=A0ABD2KV54_9BILA